MLIYRGSTNERLSGEGVAYDSYYNETDRVISNENQMLLQINNSQIKTFSVFLIHIYLHTILSLKLSNKDLKTKKKLFRKGALGITQITKAVLLVRQVQMQKICNYSITKSHIFIQY